MRAEDYPVLAAIWDNEEDDAAFATCSRCDHAPIEHSSICPETGELDIYCSACLSSISSDRTEDYEPAFHDYQHGG